jgi:hypothetical protein
MSSNGVANIILAAGAPHVGEKPPSAVIFVLNDTVAQWTMTPLVDWKEICQDNIHQLKQKNLW